MTTLAEKIAVMQAAERGEEIEFLAVSGTWYPSQPGWNWTEYVYRVKPPTKCQIKMYAHLAGSSLIWVVYEDSAYQRIPAEDKIIEVDA